MQQKLEQISVADALRLKSEKNYGAAIDICDRILEVMPENATAICVRENCRWRSNADPQDCIDKTRRALEIAPDSPVVRYYLSMILVSNGKMEEAQKLLKEAMELAPDKPKYFFELAESKKFRQEDDVVLSMAKAYEKNDWAKDERASAGFALAKIYDDLNQPEKAIKYCLEANAATGREFDVAAQKVQMDDLIELSKRGMIDVPTSGLPTETPIFILGMPRSGTTLVETILSRHREVFAAGELSVIPAVQGAIMKWLRDAHNYKGGRYTALERVTADILQKNGNNILEIVSLRADKPYSKFTDKLPVNALHMCLISRIFPNARIVYVRRHPLDCCVSNLFKQFNNLDFSFQQDWLGGYYRNLTDTVEISRKMIDNPILDLSYQQLVSDPDTHVRRLVDFVGLDWDEACLSPEKSDRSAVMTASRWQVRQPIYTGSKDRWKRYEPWLQPLIEALGGMDWIENQVDEAMTDPVAIV